MQHAEPTGAVSGPRAMLALSAEEIMRRVRAEIASRRAGGAASDGRIQSEAATAAVAAYDCSLPAWRPVASRLPDQPQYVLNDFLRFDDADFVDVAYQALLRRPSDLEGRRGYLDALRSGVISKVEILGLIRFSGEGRRQAVHVNGLLLPYKLHRWRHVSGVGWILGMAMALAKLPRLAWKLQRMEASAAHETQELGRLLNRLEDTVSGRFGDVNDGLKQLRAELEQTVMSRVEGLRVISARVGAMQATVGSIADALRASDVERASLHAGVKKTLAAHEACHVELVEVLRNDRAELRKDIEVVSSFLKTSDADHASAHAQVKETLAAHAARAAELVEALRSDKSELRKDIQTVSTALQASDAQHASQHAELRANDAMRLREHSESANRLTVHDAALARLEDQTRSDYRALRAVLDRLTVFLDVSARQARKAAGDDTGEPSLEEQYASFEQTFRGDREQIKQRATHYLGTLAAAGIAPSDEGVVLDLGSGRGEWLEVLAEHGYRARGVDMNRGMLKESLAHGHDVVEAEALDYLRTQPDRSLAAITSMHMVEHMPHPAVIRLLDEALRVLRPGGALILETPNPENVLVGSCMFYMDPTHLHPIPPPLLQWTVQTRGFEQAIIERLSEHRGSPDLTPVSNSVPGAAQINQMIAWFTAPPDYAVVARAPQEPSTSAE